MNRSLGEGRERNWLPPWERSRGGVGFSTTVPVANRLYRNRSLCYTKNNERQTTRGAG
jgi:hypothetical protein